MSIKIPDAELTPASEWWAGRRTTTRGPVHAQRRSRPEFRHG